MSDAQLPSVARQISVRTVIEAMLNRGPISRAELARVTGLSKQTASEVVRVLEGDGWIRECGQIQGQVGRSATTYEFQAESAFVFGIDLGGTKIHVAVADMLGGILGELENLTDPRGGLHVTRQISDMLRSVARTARVDPTKIRYGAMGSPGVFQRESGRIMLAPNIPGFDEIDVAGALQGALGFPVAIENDVNVAAMGERWRGRGQACADFAFIALGTGIGMGLICNGQLVRGARGGAGEIAYLPLGGDPFDARGYRLGTLETAIGSAAIQDRYRALGGHATLDVRGIFERLGQDDAAAQSTLAEVARQIAQAVMAIQCMLDPELIVLGGSIGSRPELVDAVAAILGPVRPGPFPIAASQLGARATLIGAVGLALDCVHDTIFGVSGLQSESVLGTAKGMPEVIL